MVMSDYDIQTIDDLIRELGGNTAVAEWLDISQEAVCNWKRRGVIATGWHMRLAAAARRKGRTVNPEVFGLSVEDTRGLLEAS
jgi:hypothetical protein